MRTPRAPSFVILLLAAALLGGQSGALAEQKPVTAKQVIARFRAATGDTLVRDSRGSVRGAYDMVDFGAHPSLGLLGKYGQFFLYVVHSADTEKDVAELLADAHSGQPIAPDARGIRWEYGVSLRGERYWTAKKRYGRNVVMLWLGTSRKATDRGWERVNGVLNRIVR